MVNYFLKVNDVEGRMGNGRSHVLASTSSEVILNEKAQGILQISLNSFIECIFLMKRGKCAIMSSLR